ncbi:DUF6261 family protein [Saccharicrinis aurantiacus]|uniref:DUF6261 family protein n=1 Tax=Saccharicrinis aurantiacus TaxID=1849719 RepID=UPI0024922409|nr:DUF6261 family protein [Saccharicrinis aurantiacus]
MKLNTASAYIHRKSVSYANLTNDRFLNLVKTVTGTVATSNLTSEHIAYLGLSKLSENIAILDQILSNEKKQVHRSSVDAERDTDFIYIRNMLQANKLIRDETKNKAAEALLSVFNSFDINLDSLALDIETEELDRVLLVWNKADNAIHFETLDLSKDLAKLNTSVKAYKDFDSARGNKSKKQTPKVREIRSTIQKQFCMWLDILKGLANLNDDAACYQCLKAANTYITAQDAYVKSRATRKSEAEIEAQ